MNHKACTNCGEDKPLEDFDLRASRKHKDGHHTQCKTCSGIYNRAYHAVNRAKILVQQKGYRDGHESIKEVFIYNSY